jgi:predicted metal-binding membrane protein
MKARPHPSLASDALATVPLSTAPRARDRRWAPLGLVRQPEAWTVAICLGAWSAMLIGDHGKGGFDAFSFICGDAGSATSRGGVSPASSVASLSIGGGARGWALMVIAMMTPLAIPAAVRFALAGAPGHRAQTLGAFLFAHGAVWILAGLAALLVSVEFNLQPRDGRVAAIAFLAAAFWEATPLKRRALDACGREIASGGSKAPFGGFVSLRRGAAHGVNCLMSCGAMMLAAMSAGHSQFFAMAIVAAICATQRLWPRAAPAFGAFGLLGLAGGYAVALA